ncbi:MAG: ATP-dependent helicase, partial [Campylobacterales bacterium]
THGVLPEEILLLTFTNKAAAEMIARLERYFDKSLTSKIEAGTFHALSYRWLKRLDQRITLKLPSELKMLFRTVYDKRAFHRLGKKGRLYSHSHLYDLYSLYQNSLEEDFEHWIISRYHEQEEWASIYADIISEFEELKAELGFAGFNDLLIWMKKRLDGGVSLGFKEVLIDEYQDTNPLQGAFVTSLRAPSLFCVGDYDQSIYAFNGADISIIASFAKRYPDARIFTLQKNYRSTALILSLANRVIAHNERIYPKKLQVVRTETPVAPKLIVYDDVYEQYQGISKIIAFLDTQREEVAILFRNNSSADGMEVALRKFGIKCRRKGSRSLFETREIKALLHFLALFVNVRDILAFIHLFEYAKGVGANIAKEICDGLMRLGGGSIVQGLLNPDLTIGFPFEKRSRNSELGLFDDFIEIGSVSRFSGLGFDERFLANPVLKHPRLPQEGAKLLYELYQALKSLSHRRNPSALLEGILQSALYGRIIDHLALERSLNKDGTKDEKRYEEAKEKIIRKAYLLEQLARNYRDAESFLNAMILGASEMSEGEGVHLLSVHASKGLEFRDVFLIDLMDGRFPNHKLMAQGGTIEEERRLFYVATTRAMDRLWLSYARQDRHRNKSYLPSPFLIEAGLITA